MKSSYAYIPSFSVSDTSSSTFPVPTAGRVMRRRTTGFDTHQLWHEEDSSDLMKDEAAKSKPVPKRIARRRDTFCELLESPVASPSGQKPIRMRIVNRVIADKESKPASSLLKTAILPKFPQVKVRGCKIVLDRHEVDRVVAAQKSITETGKSECAERSESIPWHDNDSEGGSVSSFDPPTKRVKLTKNTDQSLHAKTKKMSCALCSKKPIRNIVYHYVNEHDRYEVFNARMSPKMTDQMRKHGGSCSTFKNTSKGYDITAFCPFCEETRTCKSPIEWIAHITRHTGEFMRYCKLCGVKSAAKMRNNGPGCSHSQTGTIRTIRMPDVHLSIYICNICNYAQMRKKNVESHLKRMHKIHSNVSDHYKLVDIVKNFRKTKLKIKQLSEESDDDIGDDSSDDSSGHSDPSQSDVFRSSSEQDDGLIDKETLQLMQETTFNEDKISKPSTSMIDTLSERFRKQEEMKRASTSKEAPTDIMSVETVANLQITCAEQNNEVPVQGEIGEGELKMSGDADVHNLTDSWESCTGSDESENECSYETETKHKVIQDTLMRLNRLLKMKPKRSKKPQSEREKNDELDKNKRYSYSVQNVGFSFQDGKITYLCFIDGCGFDSTTLVKLLQHLREHMDVVWSGFCFACRENIYDTKTTLANEFQHLETKHLKNYNVNVSCLEEPDEEHPVSSTPSISHSIQVPSSDAIRNIVKDPPNSVAVDVKGGDRPRIKCRRVSGDLLSINKGAPVPSSSSNFQPNALTIINRSKDPRNFLKPWTKCPFIKSESTIQLLVRDVSLIALYKCMGMDCIFTTADPIRMMDHLRNHEEFVSQYMNSNREPSKEYLDHLSWLECSYCDKMEESCGSLVEHIRSEHSTSIYQCPYCFYRTVDASNVKSHLNSYHKKAEPLILVAMGQTKQLHSQISVMLRGREEFVKPIKCGDEGNFHRIWSKKFK